MSGTVRKFVIDSYILDVLFSRIVLHNQDARAEVGYGPEEPEQTLHIISEFKILTTQKRIFLENTLDAEIPCEIWSVNN